MDYHSIQNVVKAGKPLESRLYYMVATERMPKGSKLSEEKNGRSIIGYKTALRTISFISSRHSPA